MTFGLVGLLILVLAPGLTLVAAILAARFSARRLAVPGFRLGTPSTRQTFSKHCAARCAGVGVAFLAAFVLSFAAARTAGTPTMSVAVTPAVDRRIGVEERVERRPSTVGEATRAFRTALSPLLYLGSQVRLAFGNERTPLSGPVGIVRDVSRGRSATFGAVLTMAALLASFVWPVLAAVHAIDALLCRPRRRAGGDQ